LNRLDAGLRGGRGRIEVGLAHAEVIDILSRGLATLGFVADGHRLGSFEVLNVR
jgi:hypothetical protein